MKSRKQQDGRALSVHRLPIRDFLVVADDLLIYEGSEEKVSVESLYRAARAGACNVVYFINGEEVIHSKAVASV